VPCSASRVVPGAHRVVGPGTHRGSGPREVHTTLSATSSFSLPHLQRNEPSSHGRHLCSADAIAGCRGAPPSACHHRPKTSPEPPHCSTSPSPATGSPPLRARTTEKRLRRPQIHRAAVLHRRSILQPPDASNGTLGEPTPLPRPFPAKPGLPLAGIRPSPLLVAPRTTLQRSSSFQGLRCKN
jgi:hypothetical protein